MITWNIVTDQLPDMDRVVEMAVVSDYDGSLYRAFGCRYDSGEGWLWAIGSDCPTDPHDCDADDDYNVYAWREPTPLPTAPLKGWHMTPDILDPVDRDGV